MVVTVGMLRVNCEKTKTNLKRRHQTLNSCWSSLDVTGAVGYRLVNVAKNYLIDE